MSGSDPPHTQSVEAAEARRDALTLEVQQLQAELGDKQKTDTGGRRLSSREYWSWRRGVQQDLNERLAELRALKTWLKNHGRRDGDIGEPEAITHLRGLYLLIEQLRKDDIDLDPGEVLVLTNAGTYLRNAGAID